MSTQIDIQTNKDLLRYYEDLGMPGLPQNPVDLLNIQRMGFDPSEYSQENIEKYQMDAFRKTLAYAKEHSDFYREKMKAIDPDDIQSYEDLQKLPITNENDLAGDEWRFQCIKASSINRIVTVPTTGTKGNIKRISFTREDQEKAIEFINRGYMTMECTKGEKMIVYMAGNSLGSIGDLVIRSMKPLEMDIKVYGLVTDIKEAYEELMDFKPGVVEAVPWHAAALASYGTKYNNPEKEFIRSANLSADVVPDALVKRLESLWECTVHRHYGSTEMCIFGGVECKHHTGYHLRYADILYEIQDPDENGMGEILITTLNRKGMPLIRYRTGDIGRFNKKPCPCGCRAYRMEKVYGRESNVIQFQKHEFSLCDIAEAIYSQNEVMDFDLIVKNGKELEITARHFREDKIDEDLIYKALMKDSKIQAALDDGSCTVSIVSEESSGFPSGYNLKKVVTYKNDD